MKIYCLYQNLQKREDLKHFLKLWQKQALNQVKYMEHAELITNLGDGNSFKLGFHLTL